MSSRVVIKMCIMLARIEYKVLFIFLMNLSSNYGIPFGVRPHARKGSGNIAFPDPHPITAKIQQPKCKQGDGISYCEDLDSYPHEIISKIIKKGVVDVNNFVVDETPEDIELRFDTSDKFLCNSRQKMIFPKIGKNKKKEWKFIINQADSDGYIQGVRIEVCWREGSSCNLIGDLLQGYTTSCTQKYVYRRLMTLSDNGLAEVDLFPLPSACCCSYKRDYGFLSQYGSSFTSMKNG